MTLLGALRSFVLLLVVIALSACGETTAGPEDPGGGSSTSYVGAWQLSEGYGSAGEVPAVDGHRITLTLEETSLGGTAACNLYGGDVDIEGDTFETNGVSVTEMACEPEVMESESTYLVALSEVDGIARIGDTLTLSGDRAELKFALLPPVPTAELIDTRWELESLIHGTGSDGAVSSAQPGYLILKSDGTLEGSTGCRDLYGEWTERGDEIQFTTFGAKGGCSEELREQDNHVVGALGDGFTVEIDGARLTIMGRFGIGLGYRAAD